ncbi:MAG: hypothetical protein MJ025_00565 [Victivallaceae bacterium]|nr:hypothetical protein [Victivallaceae bacterium]
MKKTLLAILVACMAFTGAVAADSPEEEGSVNTSNIVDALALYIPNRILDLLDIFSVTLGVGPVVEARLMCTRACDVGVGIGMSAKAAKDFKRQYGLGFEEYWYWSFIFVGEESYSMNWGTPLIKKYQEDRLGVPDFRSRTYDFFEGKRDYWAIGGSLGLVVDGNLYIHPVEWVDLALGFLFIDICGDDLIFDDFIR